jgi:hypothetical protein
MCTPPVINSLFTLRSTHGEILHLTQAIALEILRAHPRHSTKDPHLLKSRSPHGHPNSSQILIPKRISLGSAQGLTIWNQEVKGRILWLATFLGSDNESHSVQPCRSAGSWSIPDRGARLMHGPLGNQETAKCLILLNPNGGIAYRPLIMVLSFSA